jgi:hypothetical protein
MSRHTTTCLCLFAAAFTLAAPACDPAELGDPATVQPRTTPPFDPTPTAVAAQPEECTCDDISVPVCGIDGGTYPSDCEAGCAGVQIDHWGPCLGDDDPPGDGCDDDDECASFEFCDTGVTCGGPGKCTIRPDLCTRQYDPVCGCDGETYANSCIANASGVSVAAPGECTCVCPLIYQPVCGVDGSTYGNACAAGCADVEVAHEGECTCACPLIYQPVCGVDGSTYGNACAAGCADVEVAHEGECCADPGEKFN